MAANSTVAQPFDFLREDLQTKQRGLWEQAFRRLVRNRLAIVSLCVLLLITVTALLADFIPAVAHHPADAQDYGSLEKSPSADFWLGTDGLGRDLWARLLEGTLFSLKIGILAQVVILSIGITVGMLAALGGRWSDTLLMWFTDLAYAFPDLLAIILFRQILLGREWPVIGDGNPQIPGFPGVLLVTILAISFVSWVTVSRLVRGQMLSIKETDYVTAARAIGASPLRVVAVHMLPNTLGAIIVAVTFGIPLAIFAEAALGFIGLGVPPPAASLGTLISDGLDHIQTNPIEILWPSITVATLMLCFTFLGDGLRDALDPRTRK
ncbi:MAG: ABC transporter permease [Thermoflexaceae bacterium]|nr:ABC transporter permease [Thermoflexaceae bacterium]